MRKFCMVLLFTCLFHNKIFIAQPKLLLIEGNIGVGKTTFLKMLADFFPNAVCISEPCDEWQNIEGYNLLDAFYKDNKRWACTMQLYVLVTLVNKLQKSIRPDCDLYIMERSVYTSKYCFAQNLALMGMMNELEWALYCNAWNWYVMQTILPSGIIYLQADPEVCYNRMKIRARNEEDIVPLHYLQSLHDRHNEWLVQKTCKDFTDIPVLTLDASCNFKEDIVVKHHFMSQILDFLRNQENTVFTV